MRILAIETSCDETSVAVVEDGTRVVSNVISSSMASFKGTGGVIPEEAARKQVECMLPVLHEALTQAGMQQNDMDAVAVTKGPGLLGSLLVGATTARVLARLWQKPLVGVHHTLGHLSSTWLDATDEPQFPVLTLSASGGHTDLWLRTSHTHGTLIGRTRDDAAGEAFDKGASLLDLPYPGGPSIAKAALDGKIDAFDFPLPLKKDNTLDFSFSGLKTALRYVIRDLKTIHEKQIADLAASYQAAICTHLLDRLALALDAHPDIQEIHVVGGVSANTFLRETTVEIARGKTVRFPLKMAYCTDNAAMIAAAAAFMIMEKNECAYDAFETIASLSLSDATV